MSMWNKFTKPLLKLIGHKMSKEDTNIEFVTLEIKVPADVLKQVTNLYGDLFGKENSVVEALKSHVETKDQLTKILKKINTTHNKLDSLTPSINALVDIIQSSSIIPEASESTPVEPTLTAQAMQAVASREVAEDTHKRIVNSVKHIQPDPTKDPGVGISTKEQSPIKNSLLDGAAGLSAESKLQLEQIRRSQKSRPTPSKRVPQGSNSHLLPESSR